MNRPELPRVAAGALLRELEALSASFREKGAPLYATLCAQAPTDAVVMELASRGLAAAPVLQLFAAVHYLLLGDPADPLARYYPSLTERPEPPDQAFAAFADYCRRHRSEILEILETRTVQMTMVERCCYVLPPLSYVAGLAGEPLNLIEIGCSAGVLLTADKYAYQLEDGRRLGAEDAPFALKLEVVGGPKPHIPRIGRRIGVDLVPIDVRSEDERRWLLAFAFPEWRGRLTRLKAALEVVAATDISRIEGDALEVLPRLIAETEGPLCLFHSACVVYWTQEAKAALDRLLIAASRGREFYRLSLEKPEGWSPADPDAAVEIVLYRYRDGTVDRSRLGHSPGESAQVIWTDSFGDWDQ